jgi:hypothetical protein
MKRALLTSAAAAALAGSQIGFAACSMSAGGPNTTSASCDSTVTLKLDEMVVLKGLDDYDFSDPGAAGWDGTDQGKAAIPGSFCVGTNSSNTGVSVTVSSTHDFEVQRADGSGVSYSAFLGSSTTALSNATGANIALAAAVVDDLACANELVDLTVEFAGTALLAAAVGAEAYTDTITVTVAPN